MAKTFKSLLGDDIVNTRTMLHEAIPITGTISSGTYGLHNIKTFSHGMFESVYDYPYLSSSANHIFDITFGYSSAASASANSQNSKKLNDGIKSPKINGRLKNEFQLMDDNIKIICPM